MKKCFDRGVSSFIAFAILISISVAIAIYLYTTSSSLINVYRPRVMYSYSYVTCYNITSFVLLIDSSITICRNSSMPKYLCVFRALAPIDLYIVYNDYIEYLHINGNCVTLLENLPTHIQGLNNNMVKVIEVRFYEPWTK